MNISMTLTLDGMLRALRGRVHSLAEEVVLTGRADAREDEREADSPVMVQSRTGRDDRASR
jgi:hypothetical protein